MSSLKKVLVYIVEPLKVIIFSVTLSLAGFTYGGKSESPVYMVTMIFLFLLCFFYYVRYVLMRNKMNRNYFLILFILLSWFIISFVLWGIQNNYDYSYTKYFYFFFIFSFDSILWGIHFGKGSIDNLHFLVKWFEPFAYLISIFSFVSVFLPIISGSLVVRGEKYQSNSYYCAFAFGCLVFYLFDNSPYRFKIFSNGFFKFLTVALLCLLPITIISTGGRGGFVLLIINMVLGIVYFLKKKSGGFIKVLQVTGVLLIAFFGIKFTLTFLENVPELQRGLETVLEFWNFETHSINMEGSSGRDVIYEQAWALFWDKPFLGYGFFEYMPLLSVKQYPHNMFLEVMLQGGVGYLLLVLTALCAMVVKFYRLLKIDSNYWLMVFMFVYPFTMLLFSGTYLSTPLFWFCLTAILCSPTKMRVKVLQENYAKN